MLTCLLEEQLIQNLNFLVLTIHMKKGSKNLIQDINFLDSKTDFALNIQDILPSEIWWNILFYLNNSQDLVTLLYVSKFTRHFVLRRYDNHFFISSGFCAFEFWERKLLSNRFNLLSKLYTELDIFFIMIFGR